MCLKQLHAFGNRPGYDCSCVLTRSKGNPISMPIAPAVPPQTNSLLIMAKSNGMVALSNGVDPARYMKDSRVNGGCRNRNGKLVELLDKEGQTQLSPLNPFILCKNGQNGRLLGRGFYCSWSVNVADVAPDHTDNHRCNELHIPVEDGRRSEYCSTRTALNYDGSTEESRVS